MENTMATGWDNYWLGQIGHTAQASMVDVSGAVMERLLICRLNLIYRSAIRQCTVVPSFDHTTVWQPLILQPWKHANFTWFFWYDNQAFLRNSELKILISEGVRVTVLLQIDVTQFRGTWGICLYLQLFALNFALRTRVVFCTPFISKCHLVFFWASHGT